MPFKSAQIAVCLCSCFAAAAAAAEDRITVAYFLEWPTPSQFGQATGAYEEALGVKIDWRPYATGSEMGEALVAGEAQIAFSQGMPPFVVGVSSGLDLTLVDVAVSYSENDNCVAQQALGLAETPAEALNGSSVVLPLGSAAHYGFLRQMEALGVDVAGLSITDMPPAEAAEAFAAGDYDIACAWGGALRQMLDHGEVLLTGAEKEALGIFVFDATTVSNAFLEAHPEHVAAFVATTAKMNAAYAEAPQTMIAGIAEASALDKAAAKEALESFTFLTVDEQLSPAWLGGGTQRYLKEVADFLASQGQILDALDSYDHVVDRRFLEALIQD